MPKKDEAEKLMEGLNDKKTTIKGTVKIDVYFAEVPASNQYVENLIRQLRATEVHTMDEWKALIESDLARPINSD